MRLNPFYPSDDPMSSVFYCFGGGGDSGGDGGGGGDYDEDDFANDQGFTEGFGGGGAGDRATQDATDRATGGGGNDKDNRPSPAVNPGNIGVGSGAGLGATSNANFSPAPAPAPAPAPSFDMDAAAGAYIDQAIANFGVGPTVGVMPDPFAEAVAAGTAVPGPSVGGGDAESAVAEFNIFDTPEFQDMQSRLAEQQAAAERDRILGIASSAMTQDDVYNMFGGPGPRTAAPVSMAPGPRPSAQGPVDGGVDDFNTGAFGTRADLGITPNPIESRIGLARALENLGMQAEEEQIFTPINMQFPSLIGAGINLIGGAANAAQMYGGGNIPGYAQNVMNRPGGAPVMANAPMMSPAQPSPFQETLMAASDRQPVGPYSEAEGVPAVLGGFGPNQLSFLPGEPDNIYVGDPRGIEQAQMLDPNVQVLDENYFSQGQDLSDRGGDQAAPPALTLPDPVTQECPEGYTRDGSGICVYEGQPRMGVTPYTPMAPVEFSYTGLPSLAPRTLTPTAPNLSFLNRR